MIEQELRKAIYLLHHEGGMGIRELNRRLKISRETIHNIIKQKGEMPSAKRGDAIEIDPQLLHDLHGECDGYKQRMLEKLVEEKEIEIKYSTLTRKVRALGIGQPAGTRCDKVPDEPGAEMQHDTSPWIVDLDGVPTKVTAAQVYLRYCKRRFLQFYRVFDRFRMKCFLHKAFTHWEYVAPICIIDNTNLARLRGTGPDAIIVPEMVAFGDLYGFRFVCHKIKHSNRKAGEERAFYTAETNFLPGRKFKSLEDLNGQALDWSTVRIYNRELTKAKIIPAVAFEFERAYLKQVPPFIPPPYQVHTRGTNQYGYVPFDGNFYWVPGDSRFEVRLLEYSDSLKLYRGRDFLIEYPLPAYGIKNQDFIPEGAPRPSHRRFRSRKPSAQEEARLRDLGDVVCQYLDFALKPKGIERHRMVRELFALSRTMTPALFVQSLTRALKYKITSLQTIERIALLYLNEGAASFLPDVEVDDSYREREAYREGCMTDVPDLSGYDKLVEEDHG